MSDTTTHIIEWRLRSFDALSPHELYALLRLRSEVFVVEQACIFLDMDNMDQDCWHLLGWKGTELLAATRLVPPGVAYEYASIGRWYPTYRNDTTSPHRINTR
jgi:ElaA protein